MKKIVKKIYEVIPFKKQFFTIVRSLIKLPEPIYKHLHFNGVIEVKIDANHSFKMIYHGTSEENELFLGGIDNGWEKTSLKLWRRLCIDTPTGSALDAIQHKENGYLVDYKNAVSMAEGLIYTLEHGADFREKGQKTALEMYNFDLMFNNYIKLYEKND